MNAETILIIDDEKHIIELIEYNLKSSGYNTLYALNGKEGLLKARAEKPSLILLDLMLPIMDGIEVCKEIRQDEDIKDIPIIMLTAKSEEVDKIIGLELGADDYITKPFSVRELLARIKAVLRRINKEEEENKIFKFSDVIIDYDKHEVTKAGITVELTLKEFELLDMLIKNKGKVLKREEILDEIWGYGYVGETRTVDVHIRHLRKKLENNDKYPEYIETVRGIGYRFSDMSDE